MYWSPKEVADWLTKRGLQEYSETFKSLNGQGLLRLTQGDFKKPPLSRVSSDNGRQLLEMIETLKIENHIEEHKNGHANGHIYIKDDINSNNHSFTSKAKKNGMPNGVRKEMIKIPMPEVDRSQAFPNEWNKTLIAFLYALCCFIFTTVMISIVHERVPDKTEEGPLPDVFFDHFDRVAWAFSICEINGLILLFGNWEAQIRRILKMLAGGGLTITGGHKLCGDYLYSGHTVMLTLTYMFIKEYSSRRLWLYHWFCWSLSVVGIFCILLAHDHYTVDVVIAYYITSRCFWWYHTMANQQVLKEASPLNLLSRVWWYRPFEYFERNVHGVVPRSYQWPIPWSLLPTRQVTYSRLINEA
ncbi:hypothetical protein GDO78_008211 [Eleutherodactylus coqui]|uniref:Phosphatidylcholine:ceramide cholinephosphotransferase 1 n=1 Tax=Eleutherodactylus coqui TaxID=57060 RepID=A0A8J6KAW1_ELECQ|nr:hypothetical protein GDO78_008211 [Eleutherodactylus coqui]